ncbi:tetratricopeptide repeat protein [Treponema sp. OMZ 305]|uniref:periplasmic flagellar collar protein FlcA n=1 Tax=Treponema sp. OMZ 305 TaxID=1659192 RepID=UPI0020A25BCB|nr:tetratricopeptide repeat protein [Treponema sp. OMZ 305]UTC58411.1 tetratricopeptide repeat protein [Treponema sp. OMZ 305]
MPNLNEITKFREDLKKIAHEDGVTARWGERVYDELPLPNQEEVPDIDLDALLPATEPEQTAAADDAVDKSSESMPASQQAAESVPDMFDTVPVTDAPDISMDTPFPTDFGDNGIDDTGSLAPSGADDSVDTESPQAEEPSAKPDEPEVVTGDAYPVDEEGMPDTSDMDTFLSSFDFDNLSGDDSDASDIAESTATDEPSTERDDPFNFDDMLSSFDFAPEPIKANESTPADDTIDDDTIPEDVETLDESDEVPADEDMLQEERTIPDITIPDIDLSAFDSSSDDASSNPDVSGDLDEVDDHSHFDVPDMDDDEETAQFPVSDETTQSNTSAASTVNEDESGSTTEESDSLDNMDELSLFSENRDDPPAESADDGADASSFEFSMDTPSTEPISIPPIAIPPIAGTDVGFDGIGMPEHITDTFFNQPEGDSGDQSGFSLEENPLDSDITEVADDQFNLPDNFKDFSADAHSQMFDSVIAKSTGSSDDGEALTISDDDYFNFLNKLETFPFNVQLAIQDYIANGDDRPENKMNFIRFVLEKDSLKKVVNKLEKIINRSIPIPRGFQRKTVEEYEREKQTFKYWFMHRFLPVAVMSAIALILVFCISVLSWQFIYKPIRSEAFYKTGYSYLENGQYETAIEKFNRAGDYKRKKKWYFSYARAFRAKKQFTAAEKMYLRLIYDFANDKQGGLEYADMLSTDLRNYEKAEAVLRRRVLDHYVNDKDGMLALGDVFMNWADEDPEKYDDAVKVYSRLIELYGESDTFLVRMMRYFIRTDNLAEVLNLKDHFSSRITKIGAENLTELSGYLLEKRYNPKPLDSEKLRSKIDDVRMLLEKAVQTDKTMPEAYYNLGRFFIYNNKQDGAIENLTESIKLFKTAAPMTARRTGNYVDAMRLLGEQLVDQKKYLEAQTLYADALNIYREYTAFKPLPPNKAIGKLYADYGDIDYFISYNFDSALDSYQNAVKELYNTPSVNYRIGYIHYQQENYRQAIEAMSHAYAEKAHDKNLLYGFGNAFFKRGDYFAALAAYEELLGLLNAQRARKEQALSNTRPDDVAFIERYMHTANNLGATLSRLSERTGDSQKNGRALALYAESTRAWDALTRNPQTMIRAKSVGLAYLNTQNMLNTKSSYQSEIYTDIPMILENERALEQKEDK